MPINGLSPSDLGFPSPPFDAWRDCQSDAIDRILSMKGGEVLALNLPTGSGKSLVAAAAGLLVNNPPTIILTVTKALQDQYASAFNIPVQAQEVAELLGVADPRLVEDIRGRANYYCPESGSCLDGQDMGCQHDLCPYLQAFDRFTRGKVGVANYSWHLANSALVLGNLLILDEAHLVPEHLTKSMSFRLWEGELKRFHIEFAGEAGAGAGLDMSEWVKWKSSWDLDQIRAMARSVSARKDALSLINRLRQMPKQAQADLWHVSEVQDSAGGPGWEFEPVHAAPFVRHKIFRAAARVAIMSGSLIPKTVSLFGLSSIPIVNYPRDFPPNRCPIYHIPTVRMRHGIHGDGLKIWAARIDEILSARADRKGIIHTVSYDRQKQLLDLTKYRSRMIVNGPGGLSTTVAAERFRAAGPGAALVSPSFAEGWDFPNDQCEYIIISKVPFPPMHTTIMKRRLESDPSYTDYLALQDTEQASARGMRHKRDRCETFIVDDAIVRLMAMERRKPNDKKFNSAWWNVRTIGSIPPAPPKL